jgi:hypothetical protein
MKLLAIVVIGIPLVVLLYVGVAKIIRAIIKD